MNIVIVSSEMAPYAVAGALGLQVAELADTLTAQGHHVTVIVPQHPASLTRSCKESLQFEVTKQLYIRIRNRDVEGKAKLLKRPYSQSDVLLIEQAEYFNRPDLYQQDGQDFADNCERFVFLSRAALQALQLLKLKPDVIHCFDWETGLIPALLKIEHRATPELSEAATVLTILNLQYQGRFWHWDMELTGLDWKYFNWRQMEFFGQLNLLKTGIVFADTITVSTAETAKAIQFAENGYGLHGVLRQRSEHLIGITDGPRQFLEVYRHALRNDPTETITPH